ncbi:TonB-dependent receptor [Idiomarina sp.]|uniref:TonB-dependent receptor n=1 Tax=Idiomarina sp. TaxID=1874361 RepID=UPI003A913F00
MNNKINYLTRSIRILIYGMSVVSVSALAQQAEENEKQSVEEDNLEIIEVTSSRRVQTIQDTPAAVYAVDPDSFIQRGLTSISDVVEEAPGFSFSSATGQAGRGSISARGVSQQNDSPVTAIYLDDVPLTSSTGFAAGGRLFFDGLLGDVARVELVKGPQGTLFGATAIAGAVRYITNEPEVYDSRGKFTVDYSQTKGGDLNQLYRGFYSFPLIEGKLGLTLAGFSQDNGGYVDQVSPATGSLVRENANDSENKGYSADLYYTPTDKFDIRLKAMKQESSFNLSSAVRIASIDKDEAYGEFLSDSAYGSDELTQTLYSVSASYEMEGAVLDFTSSKAEYEGTAAEDVVSLYGPIIEQLEGLPAGSVDSAPLTRDVGSDKSVHELRLTSTTEGNYEWLVGLFYSDESTKNSQRLTGMPQDILALNAEFPSDYEELAAFGNYTYYLAPNFDITAGLRVSKTEQSLIFVQEGPLLGGGSVVEELETAKETVETYLLTARYRPTDDTSFYTRIASGYRPASSNLSVRNPFTGEILSQPVVEQDDLWSYEVGVKGALADNKFNYESALYYIDWKNFQTIVTFFGIGTDGNARNGITVQGWEGSFDYQITPNLAFKAAAAYNESTLNEDEPELFGLKGATVPNTPKWTFNSSVFYDYQLPYNMNGWISASANYKDSMNSAFVNGDPENPSVNLPSDDFTTINLTTGVEKNNWLFTLYVNNLLDKKAYTFFNANAVPGSDVVDITGIPLEPRTIGVSVSYSF